MTLRLTLLLLLAACQAAHAAPAQASRPAPLVLVSLDGVRADLLDRRHMPRLSQLAAEGARARWMRPSYPTLTFPNHYTLVTGLRPDRHGVIHNQMRDPALGAFTPKDAAAVADGRWWSQAEPLWVTAERAGLPTATLGWPGGSARIRGVRPREWRAYDEHVPEAARVDTVLAWLRQPEAVRPRFVALYLERFDQAAHDNGPSSQEANRALHALDAALGRLVDGLRAQGQLDEVNLVVVSDHGMATVPRAQRVPVELLVPDELAEASSTGQVLQLTPRPGREADAAARLPGRHAHHACWLRTQLPARWHYGRNTRIAPIVCQMDAGWDAVRASDLTRSSARGPRGSHGYDPALPAMRALFVAHGPAFRRGARLAPLDNVDVYPLLAQLLGLAPANGVLDGDARSLQKALRHPR